VVRQYKALLATLSFLLAGATPQLASNRIKPYWHEPGAPGQAAPQPVRRDWLLNELQLMVVSHPGTGAVSVHLRVNSGAMFDLAGKGGLADLTAGMLLKSVKGFPAKDLSEFVAQSGMSVNVKVGWDSTDIVISGPAAALESILDLLGRLVINPSFDRSELDSLKAARIKELSAEKSTPLEIATEAATETVYGKYPMGRPVHGTAESISKISLDDIVYYHDRFYLANDSELVVEGDVLAEEVTKPARSKLGVWKKGEKVPATFVPPVPLNSRRIVVADRPESSNANIVIAGLGISRRSNDYLACAVMARLLESEVARSIDGAANGVRTRLEARYLAGPLLVSFDSPAEKAPMAIQAVIDAMERLKTTIPQEDLDRAKQSVFSLYAHDLATDEGQIAALLDIERYGLGRDYMMNFEARVAAVTAEEVKSAAQKHLSPAALVISVVGPGASLSESLKKLGQVSLVGNRPTL
jgi:zinc protease